MKMILGIGLLAVLSGPAAALVQSPTVVELYQSQGCSSCPPAIRNVNALADRPNILTLMFAVTYWDRLGWKDTFARPEFTSRQYDYARGLHHEGVFTPQVVINGRADLVGTDRGALDRAIGTAESSAGPVIAGVGNSVSVSAAQAMAPADVWLVRYDPRTVNVDIGAGENSGVTIAHRNVVRALVRLGIWRGIAESYPIQAPEDPRWRTAILVQVRNGGPILGAKEL